MEEQKRLSLSLSLSNIKFHSICFVIGFFIHFCVEKDLEGKGKQQKEEKREIVNVS